MTQGKPAAISATYRVTTPMFLGGADPKQAELRLPSFKGALRFWWRALARDRCRDVRQLRQEEAALFGSSDENVGQSKVLMRLVPTDAGQTVCRPPQQLMDSNREVGEGARYLGYGVMEAFASHNKGTKAAQLTRSCLLAPFSFTVELLYKTGVSEKQRNQVQRAIKVLGLLGGLGSKARKGYGSLTLMSLDGESPPWKPPENTQELVQVLSSLLGSSQIQTGNADDAVFNDLPEWTAFSPASRILILNPDKQDRTSLALLDRVGREMVRYRSWGRNGKVLRNQDREENFKGDHDLMKKDWKNRNNYPERIVFGLPHNYGKSTTEHVEPAAGYDRRASPLFIHVHQVNDQSVPIAALTFIPSIFLPREAGGVSVGKRERRHRGSGDWEKRTVVLADENFWSPVSGFLNRLLDQNQRQEPFGTVVEVKHG
ncbi:type III-B CRISPR module RAMP protein Cmr1 [Planctomicrobium sp. SH664]|uniref:type III-B CRISPR module RAMP protein Cmr1 n=1 Tax=Planctomicrobium sp. SH664 TaxID=3448125 RepID=UPI003F5CAAA5